MNDMTSVCAPKSDQINADDLISGPMTITVRDVVVKGGQEQPVSIYFEGSEKAFRPCKSMSRILVAILGPDSSKYIGKSMTLYRDPEVKWGGMAVGGIRISHVSHMDAPLTIALTATKGNRKPFKVMPLQVAEKVDSAAKWAAEFIAAIDGLETVEAVNAHSAGGQKAIDKLKNARPELFAQVEQALANRLAEIAVAQSDGQQSITLDSVSKAIASAQSADEVNDVMAGMATMLSDDEFEIAQGLASEKAGAL